MLSKVGQNEGKIDVAEGTGACAAGPALGRGHKLGKPADSATYAAGWFLSLVALGSLICAAPPVIAEARDPLAAAVRQTAQQGERRDFSIEAQPLVAALDRFAAQAGVFFAYKTSELEGLRSPGVAGSFTPREALQRLLSGTGVTFRFTDADTITLERSVVEDDGPMQLAPISVEAVLEGTLTESYSAPESFSATRTDTSLIDTPQSAQSITRQALEDAGATRISDAYDYLAGISQENNVGGLFGDDYLARGFATDNILFNGNRTGQPTTLDSANVERVEALRGPTAALFGRADPGGLVNVVTKQPLSEPLYQAEVIGATGLIDDGDRLRNVRATVDSGGPLDPQSRFRYRFNSAVDFNRSFRQDIEEQSVFLSPVVEAQLGDGTVANVELTYQYRQDSFDRGVFFIDDDLKLDRDFNIAEGQNETLDRHYASGTFRLDHALAQAWTARLGLYASYNDFDGEGFQVGRVNGSQVTVERRTFDGSDLFLTAQPELTGEVETGPVGHTLLFGIDASYQDNDVELPIGADSDEFDALNPDFPVDVPELSDPGNTLFDLSLTGFSLGLYVQDQMDLSEQWKLLLSLRWDSVWLTEETVFSFDNGSVVLTDRDEDFTDSALLPRAGLVYQPIEEIGIYLSYSESYRPPVAGGLTDANGEEVDAEEARNIEFGVKLDALDGRLSGTFAVYRSDKENVLEADPADPFAQVNLGDVRGQGLEFDLAGEVTENFSLGVSYAYTDTRVLEDGSSLFEADLFTKGTRLRNVPRHAASLQAAYRFTEGPLRGLRVFGGLVYEDEKPSDTSKDINTDLPAHVRLDLGASYPLSETVSASLLVRNATDTEYYTSAAGQNRVAVGEPLSVALGFRAQF